MQDISAYIESEISPGADAFDAVGRLPDTLMAGMAREGYFGALAPADSGGTDLSTDDLGRLCEAVGGASASVLSVLTVHSMVVQTLLRWGSPAQKAAWVPSLAAGRKTAAFALSEPGIGSDAARVATRARRVTGGYALTGSKKWLSNGQAADVFLVLAQLDGGPSAFLLERNRGDGIRVLPMGGMLGFRAAALAELILEDAFVPEECLIGRPGFGLSPLFASALDLGRFMLAWGCVGMSRQCLEIAFRHAASREQFGVPLVEHQLIQGMLADMSIQVRAARLLCLDAGRARREGDSSSLLATSAAKLFASRTANAAASHAIQILGAAGCAEGQPVQRHFRDAKIMEIIEGSTQILQILIGKSGFGCGAGA